MGKGHDEMPCVLPNINIKNVVSKMILAAGRLLRTDQDLGVVAHTCNSST